MGKIINNLEFQHLIENIFLNLKYEELKKCEMLNKSANQILNNPIFFDEKIDSQMDFQKRTKWTGLKLFNWQKNTLQ